MLGRRALLSDAALTSVATLIGQGAQVAALLLAARVLGPESYGIFGLLGTLYFLLGSVASLRLDGAVAVVSQRDEAHNLLTIILLISAPISLVLSVISLSCVAIWHPTITTSAMQYVVLAVIIALQPLVEAGLLYAAKFSSPIRLALYRLLLGLGQALAQIFFLCYSPSVNTLLLGTAIGLICALMSILPIESILSRLQLPSFWRRTLTNTLSHYFDIIMYGAPQVLLNGVSRLGLPLVLLFFFSPADIGLLTLAQRLAASPIQILGQALSSTYVRYVHLAQTQGHDVIKYFDTLYIMSSLVSLAGVCVAVIICLYFDFSYYLGSSWSDLPHVILALVVGFGARLSVMPISQTLTICRRPGVLARWELLFAIAIYTCVTLCAVIGSSIYTVLTIYSVVLLVGYTALALVSRRTLQVWAATGTVGSAYNEGHDVA
jgi:O-antigen/teichoic acid export membrane protein